MRHLMLTWFTSLVIKKQNNKKHFDKMTISSMCVCTLHKWSFYCHIPYPPCLNRLLPNLDVYCQSRCRPLQLIRWPDRTQASKAASLTSCDTVQSASSCAATITSRSAVPYSLWRKAANKFVHQFSTRCVLMSSNLCRVKPSERKQT